MHSRDMTWRWWRSGMLLCEWRRYVLRVHDPLARLALAVVAEASVGHGRLRNRKIPAPHWVDLGHPEPIGYAGTTPALLRPSVMF